MKKVNDLIAFDYPELAATYSMAKDDSMEKLEKYLHAVSCSEALVNICYPFFNPKNYVDIDKQTGELKVKAGDIVDYVSLFHYIEQNHSEDDFIGYIGKRYKRIIIQNDDEESLNVFDAQWIDKEETINIDNKEEFKIKGLYEQNGVYHDLVQNQAFLFNCLKNQYYATLDFMQVKRLSYQDTDQFLLFGGDFCEDYLKYMNEVNAKSLLLANGEIYSPDSPDELALSYQKLASGEKEYDWTTAINLLIEDETPAVSILSDVEIVFKLDEKAMFDTISNTEHHLRTAAPALMNIFANNIKEQKIDFSQSLTNKYKLG